MASGAGFGTLNLGAAGVEIAENGGHVFLGHDDFDFHDGLEENRFGPAAGFLEADGAGDFKGHFRAVDVVIAAVNENHGDINHHETRQRAVVHGFANAGFNGRNKFLGNRAAENLVDEEETVLLIEFPFAAGAGGKWKFDKEHRFLFIDKIFGGAIPKEFVPPIEAGIREAMDNGTLAGFMMVDVAVILVDGSYHDVDSSEMAFKIAGSIGFKEACGRAKPVLLEPIMKVEVVVPEEYMAAVFGDLNSRRAQIQGSEARAGSHVIRVQVPLAEMFGYTTDLRSRTQGRGNFTMHFSHYAEAPTSLADEIVKKARGGK